MYGTDRYSYDEPGECPGTIAYYRARYYDPASGRFNTEDPIGFGGGLNLYAYVHNNSPLMIYPMGLAPTWWHHDTTYDAAVLVFGPKCKDKAKTVADTNADVDKKVSTLKLIFTNAGWEYGGAHFPIGITPVAALENAINTCNLQSLGAALHSLQDQDTHWMGAGSWSPFIHHITGTIEDYAAIIGPRGLTAGQHTVDWLFKYKDKCLHCCQ